MKLPIVIILSVFLSHSAMAAVISAFDVDNEGWTGNPADEPGSISHAASGGNPD